MSDLSENKGFAYQFNSLIFSNQKWKETDINRDFSPDFQNFKQEIKNKNSTKVAKRNNLFINAINSNTSPKNAHSGWQGDRPKKERKIKLEKDYKAKRPDRSARVYKSQYNKPLILNEKDIDSSKYHVKKNIKCKISTPKYTQINLKRSNLISTTDPVQKGDKKLAKAAKKEFRDKSNNIAKKSKYFIELTKITAFNKSRGLSADEMMENPATKNLDKQPKTVKASKNKLHKLSIFNGDK
jgi:hypothetical protein